jgi:hypothetical protein
VACRVVAKRVPFTNADDLLPFAQHVARCLWIDSLRRSGRRAPEAGPVEQDLATADYADAVLERLTAITAWRTLKPLDRAVLMSTEDAPEEPQEYVRRYRARRRLERALEGLGVFIAWLHQRFRMEQIDPRLVMAVLVVGAVALAPERPEPDRRASAESPAAIVQPDEVRIAEASPRGELILPTASSARAVRHATNGGSYQERIPFPGARVDIGAGPAKLADAGTRPTVEGDHIVCLKNMPALGTICMGEASGVF